VFQDIGWFKKSKMVNCVVVDNSEDFIRLFKGDEGSSVEKIKGREGIFSVNKGPVHFV